MKSQKKGTVLDLRKLLFQKFIFPTFNFSHLLNETVCPFPVEDYADGMVIIPLHFYTPQPVASEGLKVNKTGIKQVPITSCINTDHSFTSLNGKTHVTLTLPRQAGPSK